MLIYIPKSGMLMSMPVEGIVHGSWSQIWTSLMLGQHLKILMSLQMFACFAHPSRIFVWEKKSISGKTVWWGQLSHVEIDWSQVWVFAGPTQRRTSSVCAVGYWELTAGVALHVKYLPGVAQADIDSIVFSIDNRPLRPISTLLRNVLFCNRSAIHLRLLYIRYSKHSL